MPRWNEDCNKKIKPYVGMAAKRRFYEGVFVFTALMKLKLAIRETERKKKI